MVVGQEPTSWTGTKSSHPRACQMELNSESITIFSKRSKSNSLVLVKTQSLKRA
jgi:hypothetical protein